MINMMITITMNVMKIIVQTKEVLNVFLMNVLNENRNKNIK